jgi:hypothetical protein
VNRELEPEASREAVGAASVAGTVAGVVAIPATGGASLALTAGAVGHGNGRRCRILRGIGSDRVGWVGILGGGIAGSFTEGGLKAAGIATSLGGEAANHAVC